MHWRSTHTTSIRYISRLDSITGASDINSPVMIVNIDCGHTSHYNCKFFTKVLCYCARLLCQYWQLIEFNFLYSSIHIFLKMSKQS